MKTRICPYCNEEKIESLENFYWRKNEKGRTERWRIKCKTCCLEGVMKWYHANYDKIKIRRKPYHVQYSKDNKEKLSKISKEWYQKNKSTALLRQKKYRGENKEYYVTLTRNWRIKHAKKLNKRERERRKNDICYALKKKLRCRISNAIKLNTKFEYKKDKKTLELLGAPSISFVWKHLKSKFKPGMNEKNHGEWHIDHIIPCASFDLKCPEQQKKCFHYTNLQPLWAKDNLSKGSKIISGDIISQKM